MRRSRWNASISRKTLRKPPGGSASLTRCGKYRSFLRPAISRLRRVIWSNSPPLRASPPHKPGSSSSTNRASARAVRRVFDYPLVRRKAEPSVNVILFPAMRPNRAWRLLGVIGPPRSDWNTYGDGPHSRCRRRSAHNSSPRGSSVPIADSCSAINGVNNWISDWVARR